MYKLLIAEDEKKVRSGIKNLMERFKYPVDILEASNGEEARIILEENQVDILMTDVEMPFLNGLQLGTIARKINPNIKIVVFSAYSKFEYARSAITLDAVHYLLKPIDINEFKGVMERVLDLCSQVSPVSLKFLTAEQDRMFRDSYKDSIFTEDILYKMPYYNDSSMDIRYLLLYVYSNKPIMFENMEEMKALVVKISCEESHIFNIDEKQCIVAFKYLYYKKPDSSHMEMSISSLFTGLKDEKPIVFTLISKEVHGIYAIKEELSQIIRLSELTFYITKDTILHTDYEKYAGFKGNTIDIRPILDSIDQDINHRNFQQLKTDIEVLTQTLTINSQMSPLYVKYVFLDIVWKLADIADASLRQEIEVATKAILTVSNITFVQESLLPVLNNLDNGKEAGSRIVETILQCIKQEYARDLSLEYIANKVFLSPAYTSSLFKKETGQTITACINQVRMNKAKELLKSTNMKLVDVSLAVGYSSQIYFSMLFKNLFGMTPTQYRETRQ